jgi:tetratricopeptide (TPR) repeat protein
MKLPSFLKQLLLASCLAGLGAQASAAGDQSLSDLRRLVDAGQFDAAFKQATTQAALQGSPHYDFLLGVAAVNSGHLAQGVLALERHLAVVPANDRARLDLAKGYYELGDYYRARQEFEFVLRYSPPKDVQVNIQKYLDAMQTREVITSRASSRSYIEVGLGKDSNVNAGTYKSQIDLLTGPIILSDPNASEAQSSFVQVSGGTQWLRRVDTSLAVFAGLDFDLKHNPAATQYNTTNLGGYSGFSVGKGSGLYRLTLSEGQMRVNGEKYRNTLSVTGEGQFSLGQGYSATGVAQYSELAHAQENAVRDARMMTLGAGVQRTFQSAWHPTVGAQVTVAKESNLHLRDDLSRQVMTARLSLAANPTERLSISAGLSRQQSSFDLADIAFGTVREDAMWSLDLGANYLWDRHWLIRADLQYTDNESNQGLYNYRRSLVGLRSRYLF